MGFALLSASTTSDGLIACLAATVSSSSDTSSIVGPDLAAEGALGWTESPFTAPFAFAFFVGGCSLSSISSIPGDTSRAVFRGLFRVSDGEGDRVDAIPLVPPLPMLAGGRDLVLPLGTVASMIACAVYCFVDSSFFSFSFSLSIFVTASDPLTSCFLSLALIRLLRCFGAPVVLTGLATWYGLLTSRYLVGVT